MLNKYSYRITPLAESDIDSALSYIAQTLSNPKAAADLYYEIEKAIENICAFPRSAKDCLCYLITDENIRHLPVGNYILIYEVCDGLKEIRILRFRYSRADLKNSQI